MATPWQLRRGTTANNDLFTGVEGEITVDLGGMRFRIHDGVTLGGHIVYNKADIDKLQTGFKNHIIGGDFGINPWQRGDIFSPTSTNEYTADRWRCRRDGNDLVTVGQTTEGNITKNSKYGYAITLLSSAGVVSNTYLSTQIESVNVYGLRGKEVVLSYISNRNQGAIDNNCLLTTNVYYTNTDDTSLPIQGTGATLITSKNTEVSTTADEVVQTVISFTVPTTAKTLFISTVVDPSFHTLGDSVIRFNEFQLEKGSVVTPFEVLPVGLTLSLCKRYYRKNGIAWGYMRNASTMIVTESFKDMRVTPSCTLLTTTPTGEAQVGSLAITGTASTLVSATGNQNSVALRIKGFTSTAGFQAILKENQIAMDSEL